MTCIFSSTAFALARAAPAPAPTLAARTVLIGRGRCGRLSVGLSFPQPAENANLGAHRCFGGGWGGTCRCHSTEDACALLRRWWIRHLVSFPLPTILVALPSRVGCRNILTQGAQRIPDGQFAGSPSRGVVRRGVASRLVRRRATDPRFALRAVPSDRPSACTSMIHSPSSSRPALSSFGASNLSRLHTASRSRMPSASARVMFRWRTCGCT